MSSIPTHAYAFFLALVGLVGIIVLTATGHVIPASLTDLTFASAAGGLGLALPSAPKAA